MDNPRARQIDNRLTTATTQSPPGGALARFAILGPVELRRDGRPTPIGGPRQVALLAFLLLHANRPVTSAALHEALWPEQEPGGAMKRVHMAITRLRKALEPDGDATAVLRTVSGGYLLSVAPGELDADVFQRALARGRTLLDEGDPAGASEVLAGALALWRGPALADVGCEEFASVDIRRLEELKMAANDFRLEAELALGRHAAVVSELQELSAREPHCERACRKLMLALYRCGRQVEALDAYLRVSARLLDDLGMDPSPELQSMQRAILEHEAWLTLDAAPDAPPALAAASAPQPSDPARAATSAAPAEPQFELPPALRQIDQEAFVGRADEMALLARCYERVATGGPGVAVISGEPGVGKSRLAREFARHVHASGAVVLHGRCEEEELMPQEPFVEALREYVRGCDASLLDALVRPLSGELRRVVPELAERVPALAEPAAGDPESARYRLFDAIATLLCDVARLRPLVLVIDDLHWADPGTLLLLKYVARRRAGERLMIVGTYRDMDVEPGDPLAGVLADLARERLTERVALGCLDERAVAELVDAHAADCRPDALREIVFRQTAGNAFFVVEALRHLADVDCAGDADPVLPLSEGVRMLVGHRIERLGPQVGNVLATAAVLGQAFDLDVIERVCDAGQDELVDAVERAVRARILVEVPGRPGRYAFGHALTRDVQYELLSVTRRALIHRRIAEAIEELYGRDLEPQLAQLAYHYGHGASRHDVDKAIDYDARAGRRDIAMLAYEQAATHYRHALGLLDAHGLSDREAERCDLTIARGEAERMAGDPAYRDTLLRGARLARELGDGERLARAARANNRGLFSSSQGIDHDRVAMLEAALDALDAPASATRARLLAQLAVELIAGDDSRKRFELADQAVAMARHVGDPDALAQTLGMRALVRWDPDTLADRIADIREAWPIAERSDDRVLTALVANAGFDAALATGDLRRADAMLERLGTVAAQLGQPIVDWNAAVSRAKRRLIDAPKEAERLAVEALEAGRRAAQPDAEVWFLGTIFAARFLQGTLDAGEPSLPALFDQPGSAPAVGPEFTPSRSIPILVTAAKSTILCEVGRLDDGRAHFELFVAELARLPTDFATLPSLAYATVACARLRDAGRARRLLALLEPHAGEFINIGGAWFGAVEHHIALLQATVGASDAATASFAAARRAYARLGAEAWLARCRLDQAMSMRDSDGGDPWQSDELLEWVVAASRSLGLGRVQARATRLLGHPVAV